MRFVIFSGIQDTLLNLIPLKNSFLNAKSLLRYSVSNCCEMDLFICHYFVPSLFLNEANKTSQDRYNFLLSFLYLLGCICKHSTNLLQNKGQLDRLTHAQWLYPKTCTFLWNGRSRRNSWHCEEEVCRWLHCCASPGLPLKIHLNSQLGLTFQSLCKNGKRDFSPSFSSIFFLQRRTNLDILVFL